MFQVILTHSSNLKNACGDRLNRENEYHLLLDKDSAPFFFLAGLFEQFWLLLHFGQNQSSSGTSGNGGSQQSISVPIPQPREPLSSPQISITSHQQNISCD